MATSGWVKIFRSIRSNWVWENGNEKYAKWWIDIIMMVNHSTKKIPMNGKMVTVNAGERITSIKKLADEWGTTRRTVDRFLSLLEQDGMLSVEKSRTDGTRMKVLNYGVYQQNDGESGKPTTQETTQGTAQGTTHKQELKNAKNEKKKDIHHRSDDGDITDEDLPFDIKDEDLPWL